MRTYAHEIGRMLGLPYGAAEIGPPSCVVDAVVAALRHRVTGQERREVRLRRDRTDAGAAAAVRDAERLVQVQVRDVAAEVAEAGEAEQRVEVGAVDVDLAAGVVHGLRDGRDLVLVHAVGRRVGDHERGEGLGVRGDLRAQVVEVDVAELVAGDDDDLHAGQHGRGRVRAVGARRDEAHGALGLAVRAVVAADGEEPGELALAAGVRLQRHRVVPGDLGEPVLELLDERERARRRRLRGRTGAARRTRAR